MSKPASSDHCRIADRFVRARRTARGFTTFPGPIPADLATAYSIQAEAIAAWEDRVAGWKVGRIRPDLVDQLGEERFVGPIFANTIVDARAVTDFPVTAGGSALFEAEVVIVTNADAAIGKTAWTCEEASTLIGAVHVGIEIAGSPLETINELETTASIAGFGNNNGLILGMRVPTGVSGAGTASFAVHPSMAPLCERRAPQQCPADLWRSSPMHWVRPRGSVFRCGEGIVSPPAP